MLKKILTVLLFIYGGMLILEGDILTGVIIIALAMR